MSAAGEWDVGQYEKFKAQRSQPFYDLLAMVQPSEGMRCIDLGCGTGELTRELHLRLLARETLGIDSSETMLNSARTHAVGGLSFKNEGIESIEGRELYDLVFSNAAFQWVPNHEALFERVATILRRNGQLAIQIPCNREHPSQTVAFDLETEEPYRGLARSRTEENVRSLEQYAALLDQLGFEHVNLRMQIYLHHLPSRDEVLEWVKGTFLLDYKRTLSPETYEKFLADYRERLMERLKDTRPHLFTFKRILMHARKA